MGKPVVFVIGASGKVGSAAVRHLSERHGEHYDIKAGTRDPEKADNLKSLDNITVVKAEMGGEGLEAILSGVDALFIVTPGSEDMAERVGKTAAAAKSAGVNFVLVVSGSTADKIDTVYGAQVKEVEEKVRDAGVQFCFLRLQCFYENMMYAAKSIKEESLFDDPVGGDKKHAMVSVDDVGKAAAAILTCWSKHINTTYVLGSAKMSYSDVAEELSAVLGKKVKYVQRQYDEGMTFYVDTLGWPRSASEGLIQYFKLVDAQDPSVTSFDPSILEGLTGEKPTTMKSFLEKNIQVFR